MITYNHENYIRAAIDSVLEQGTPFPMELVIGEDCSTDQTGRIVLQYRDSHPDLIRVLPAERNLGPATNFIRTLRACSGRYIALLDGDDYWISPYKLRKQVELLNAHPEYAICASRARVVYEDNSREPWEYPVWERTVAQLPDLLKENFIPTCTAVFRAGLLLELPLWYSGLTFADWALHILLAQHGDIAIIPEALAVYRSHSSGVWASQNGTDVLHNKLELYDRFGAYLPVKYRPLITELRAELYEQLNVPPTFF